MTTDNSAKAPSRSDNSIEQVEPCETSTDVAALFEQAAFEIFLGVLPKETLTPIWNLPGDDFEAIIDAAIDGAPEDIVLHRYYGNCRFTPLKPGGSLRDWTVDRATHRLEVNTGMTIRKSSIQKMTLKLENFTRFVMQHRDSDKKEGPYFTAATFKNDRRTKEEVESITLLAYDFDNGLELSEFLRAVFRFGHHAWIYTSHSHGKKISGIRLEKYNELVQSGFSPADILKKCKGYETHVCENAIEGDIVKESENGKLMKYQQIHHNPCSKFRLVFPLANPLSSVDFDSMDQLNRGWKVQYEMIAQEIDVAGFDRAGAGLSQPFFAARAKPGSDTFAIEIPGPLLEISGEDVKNCAKMHTTASKTVRQKTRSSYRPGNAVVELSPNGLSENSTGLERWVGAFGKHFKIVDALRTHAPAIFHSESDDRDWQSIQCPWDHHDQDGGTHIRNGNGEDGFSINCKHATCEGEPINNDRLKHLQKLIEIGNLPKQALVERRFFAGTDVEFNAASATLGSTSLPDEFRRNGKTIEYFSGMGDDGPNFMYLCDDFQVVAETTDEFGSNWALRVSLQGPHGYKELSIPMANVVGEQREVRKLLASNGLRMDASKTHRMDKLLSLIKAERHMLAASTAGFHHCNDRPVYVAPTGIAYSAQGVCADVILQDVACVEDPKAGGTLDGWKAAVAASVKSENPLFPLGVLTGFAGILVGLCDFDTTGIALTGPSSSGKSTAQRLGCSVFGNPKAGKSLLHTARATTNAFENIAARAHSATLQIDELGNLIDRDLTQFIFTLSGGRGKARQTADSSLRRSLNWSTFVVLSSERGIADIIKAGGSPVLGGHGVRIPDVHVPAQTVPNEVLDRINACNTNYGHAGPKYVQYLLAQGYGDDPSPIKQRVAEVEARLLGKSNLATERRAVRPFALLEVAGCLAQEAGVLPPEFDVPGTVQWTWSNFMAGAEGEALDHETRILNSIRQNIAQEQGVGLRSKNELSLDEDVRGYRKSALGWYDDDHYYIVRDALTYLAGSSDKPQFIAKLLFNRGMLSKSGEKFHHDHLPGFGRLPHYRLIRKTLLE